MSLEHKSLGYICSNSQQYIVWVKIIHFYFMPKINRILRSCSMKIFSTSPTVNISKLNFWLLICIAKNFIWTTLKMIFSIFRFFCTLRFQIYKYCPIITNHTSMEILFISFDVHKLDPYDWFCGPGSNFSIGTILTINSCFLACLLLTHRLFISTYKTIFCMNIFYIPDLNN